jgi:hypothetical protein
VSPEPSTGERLVRIETKLDMFIAGHQENSTTQAAQHTDHEARIRRLERALWIATGAGLLGGGGLGAIAAQLMGA